MRISGSRLGAALAILALCTGCGKKGPPLAPFDLSPIAPQEVKARRIGDRVYITMRIPNASGRGGGPFSVDHVDVFAMTIAPGTIVPPNRMLLQKPQTIGALAVRPPDEDEDAEQDAAPADADGRPAPGDVVTFVETLEPDDLQPTVIRGGEKPPAPERPRPSSAGAAPAPAGPIGPPVMTRYYVARGVTKGGRAGGPSTRIEVPLLAAPAPPRPGPSASWDAASVTIAWDPPASRTDEAPGVSYNVYPSAAAGPTPAGEPPAPLNPTPLVAPSFTRPGAEPDTQQCFVVRSVAAVGAPTAAVPYIESEPSEPICVTPKDTFPPAAPKSVAAVPSAGVVNLIWDANTEADLAGYVVLRGEAPGGTLQPLIREPIKDTRYSDRTARPGVRYMYAVIAVDRAGNRGPVSNRVEEAAR